MLNNTNQSLKVFWLFFNKKVTKKSNLEHYYKRGDTYKHGYGGNYSGGNTQLAFYKGKAYTATYDRNGKAYNNNHYCKRCKYSRHPCKNSKSKSAERKYDCYDTCDNICNRNDLIHLQSITQKKSTCQYLR